MKLSFMISLQEENFNYTIDNKQQRRLQLLADLGYEGVELAIRNPEKIDTDALGKVLRRNRLELSAVGTGLAYIYDGLSLSSLEDRIRIKAVKRIKKYIDLSRIFNTQVIIGLIRGKDNESKGSEKQYNENLWESMKYICDYAVFKDVVLALEPINRYETSFLNNVEETINFIEKIKCKNLKILLDTFHMNIEEKNFYEPIQKAKEYLSHFHFADNNRKFPGEGHIDFKQIIKILKRGRYIKYLSAEIFLWPSFEVCAQKYLENIKPYL